MSIGLGLGVLTPSATIGPVTSPGVITGGSVLQVLNLVTGADATASFDPYLPANDTIIQLDTNPSQTASHLIVFQQPGQSHPGARFAVVNSLGSASGTTGPVAAAGVKKGDIIQRAVTPVTKWALSRDGVATEIDCTSNFAPTAPANGVVTQISGVSSPWGSLTPDSILLFLRDAGSPAFTAGMWVQGDPTGGPLVLPQIRAGYKLLAALDLVHNLDLLTFYDTYAPADNLIVQSGLYSGPSLPNPIGFVLFLYDAP